MDKIFGNIYTGIISLYVLWILQREDTMASFNLLLVTVLALSAPLVLYLCITKLSHHPMPSAKTTTSPEDISTTPSARPDISRRSSDKSTTHSLHADSPTTRTSQSTCMKPTPVQKMKRSATTALIHLHLGSTDQASPRAQMMPARAMTCSNLRRSQPVPSAELEKRDSFISPGQVKRDASFTSSCSTDQSLKSSISKSPSRSIPGLSKSSKLKRLFSVHLHRKRRGSV